MTNEEAIEIFEGIDELGGISMFYQMGAKVGSITVHGIKEAGKVAITALCAQQTPATLDRSRWEWRVPLRRQRLSMQWRKQDMVQPRREQNRCKLPQQRLERTLYRIGKRLC